MVTRDDNSSERPIRRLRIDAFAQARPVADQEDAPTRSGRRVVIGAGLTLLLICVGLSLAFRDWRARYQKRAHFGAHAVAPAIDPLADVVPTHVDPLAWRQAVEDTHAMLVTLTGSNLLGLAGMEKLREEITARVTRARPETALRELGELWDTLSDRAEPIIAPRHTRPKLLPPRPIKDPRLFRHFSSDRLNASRNVRLVAR